MFHKREMEREMEREREREGGSEVERGGREREGEREGEGEGGRGLITSRLLGKMHDESMAARRSTPPEVKSSF